MYHNALFRLLGINYSNVLYTRTLSWRSLGHKFMWAQKPLAHAFKLKIVSCYEAVLLSRSLQWSQCPNSQLPTTVLWQTAAAAAVVQYEPANKKHLT